MGLAQLIERIIDNMYNKANVGDYKDDEIAIIKCKTCSTLFIYVEKNGIEININKYVVYIKGKIGDLKKTGLMLRGCCEVENEEKIEKIVIKVESKIDSVNIVVWTPERKQPMVNSEDLLEFMIRLHSFIDEIVNLALERLRWLEKEVEEKLGEKMREEKRLTKEKLAVLMLENNVWFPIKNYKQFYAVLRKIGLM